MFQRTFDRQENFEKSSFKTWLLLKNIPRSNFWGIALSSQSLRKLTFWTILVTIPSSELWKLANLNCFISFFLKVIKFEVVGRERANHNLGIQVLKLSKKVGFLVGQLASWQFLSMCSIFNTTKWIRRVPKCQLMASHNIYQKILRVPQLQFYVKM